MSNSPAEVLALAPAELEAWVSSQLGGDAPLDGDFNWHVLADTAAARARNDDHSSKWAEVALRIYSFLARNSEPHIAERFTLSEMHVRAHQVARFGACSGHPTRDSQVLVVWFRKGRLFSYAEANAKAENWRSLPKGDVRQLRAIKNQLGVFNALADHLSPRDHEEIELWLKLRPHLP